MNPQDIEYEHDRYLLNWFQETNCSIIISSYKSGSTVTLSAMKIGDATHVGAYLNTFNRVTGLYYREGQLWIGAANQIIKLVDIGKLKQGEDEFDTCFMPRQSFYTTDLDIHDIVVNSRDEVFFVSSQLNCVVRPSNSRQCFDVFWRPPWISQLVGEDRCHLNGLCLRDDAPRYVTAVSTSNVMGGWRENRQSGGVVYDLVEDRIVCQGLSMPHSPRWHNGRLWLLESGTGFFGYVDESGQFQRKTFIPGFIRGLAFYRDQYAVVCSSVDRHESLFVGLKLGDVLVENNVKAKCGVFIVSLDSFSVVHSYIFNRGPVELYDVVLVPNAKRTRMIDLFDPLMSTLSKKMDLTN
jgi:uncharacterized protein (TIGR03032 family)